MALIRHTRTLWIKTLIWLLIAAFVSGTSSASVSAAQTDRAVDSVVTYQFTHAGFSGQPVQDGWRILGDLPGVPHTRWQFYGAQIQSTGLNQFRSFEFEVAETGYYRIELKGYQSGAGGLGNLIVDDQVIGQYDFYGSAGFGPVKPVKTMELAQGKHILTLRTAGKNPPSTSYAMYPSEFILKPSSGTIEGKLDSVQLTYGRESAVVGQMLPITVTGTMDNGAEADLTLAEVTLESSSPSVATVDSVGSTLTARQVGETVVRASVSLGAVTKQVSVTVQVVEKALDNIRVAMKQPELLVGQNTQLTVSGMMNDGTAANLSGAEITYSSSKPEIAAVHPATGEVSGVAEGISRITAAVKLGGKTVTGEVDVEVKPVTNFKTRSTYYTPEKVAAARENVLKYSWAQSERDGAVARADVFVEKGHEFLWNLVPPQTLPRSYGVNQKLGSPVTGLEINKYGNYPYQADPLNEPWKIRDPSSGYKFPTNDFGAYYKSGLDEHGIFQPELADRSLLVNTLYPEKGPTWGVDDGYGWVDEKGNRYTFIAYYVHWNLWYGSGTGAIQDAIRALRDAYLYTGDAKYAHAGSILLDRIADIYPSLDVSVYDASIYLNSHGGTGVGKAVGSIWETGLIKDFISAYDAFFPAMDDPEIVAFLKAKGEKYNLPLKSTSAGIKRNIEDGIIRQVFPAVKNAQIRGNNGYHQSALAQAAVVFDTLPETKEWLDFNFQPGGLVNNPWRITGGNILNTLVNDVDRDGHGNEASPEYNRSWLSTYQIVADVLNGYDKYPSADLYQNVKFRKMFSAMFPLMMVERYTPQIGDSSATGKPGLLQDKMQAIKAFEQYGDPIFAQVAHFLNNNRTDGIHGDIFTKNPEKVASDIETVIQTHGPLDLKSVNLTGYGLSVLRDGENEKSVFGIPMSFPDLEVVRNSKEFKLFPSTGTLQFEAAAAGDSITFAFDVPASDEYEISLKPFRSTAYGIYSISIDGHPLRDFDFFGASSEHEPIGKLHLSQGKHEISFEAKDKNPDSVGIKMGLIEMSLLNAAEQERRNASVNTVRDTWMYYGRSSGHGHRDSLNLGMHAFGLDLMPDLGYPEYASAIDTHRYQWVQNTISHNTVLVDKTKQQPQWVGQPKHFDDKERVKLMDAEAPNAYPHTELYKRTTAMIQVDDANSYTINFFRVKGGSEHHFSFHGPEGTVTTEGLNLSPQESGTYAGTDTTYGVRPAGDSVDGPGYMGPGFHYLKNVERDTSPQASFSVDWDVKDTWKVLAKDEDIHVRLTMLGDFREVALADGVPPQNKPGNPKSLRYMIAQRSGENLDSLFTSVIEPYKQERFIHSVTSAEVTRDGNPANDSDVKAIKITLKDGRTDYIISALHSDITYIIDGKIEFQGFFGVYSEHNGHPVYGYVNDGTLIGPVGKPLASLPSGHLHGTVADFTREMSLQNEIIVNMDTAGIQPESLTGQTIYVENDGERNAAYRIHGVAPLDDGRFRLDIGNSTPIRKYADANDYSKGFVYDLAPGASFRIPLSAETEEALTTIASVAGEQRNGWYADDVTVTFEVYGTYSGTPITRFSLDGGTVWKEYAKPLVLSESGQHELQYQSEDGEGRKEPVKSLSIRIDKTLPTFEIKAGEAPVTNGMAWPDDKPFSLYLAAADAHSGIAEQSINVDGKPYEAETELDWAGQLGIHTIQVNVTDAAGNRMSAEFIVRVETGPDSIRELLNRFEKDGELTAPLGVQLNAKLDQAEAHLSNGRAEEAIKHLQDFLKHLDNRGLEDGLSDRAKSVLATDADALIRQWSDNG